jgi:MFS family permease
MTVLGLFMASLSTQYWQLFLAQGVCVGLGNGFLFCPAVSLLSTYFTTKRGLAIAIGAAGTGTGGMVFPAMVQRLLPRIGFPWTMRALGFIQLSCLILCCIGMRPRVPPRRTGALVDWASFKEPQYLLYAIGMFFVSCPNQSKMTDVYENDRTSGVSTFPSSTLGLSLGRLSRFHLASPSTSSSP